MSLEQKIEALAAAIEANTAALKGAGGAAAAPAADKAEKAAAPKAEKATKTEKTAPKGYEAKHTKDQATAAVNEVKEKLGVAQAKAIIKKCGAEKLSEITSDEAIDKLYDLSKEALGADEGSDDNGDI